MAEENFTLTTFFTSWKAYQDHIKEAIAPLTTAQLELRAAPHLRSVGENALHIIGCRAGWFTFVLGEDWGAEAKAYADLGTPDAPAFTPAEMVQALDHTWQGMTDCLAHWSPDDMRQTFQDDWDGKIVHLSRAWIVWHVLEHDLHHGGELSLTLGMHGIPADFPG
ncbi:MAG TPA: DinB family protein [Ktedonobacterales bacterium]|jgi:uncharacterized damage-inducible protein DinB